MKRFIELLLLLPLLLFIGYAVYLYVTSGGKRWNPIIMPAPAATHPVSPSNSGLASPTPQPAGTPASPPLAASLFNPATPVPAATRTPQPTATATRTPSPTPTVTSTVTSTWTPSPTFTPEAGASVPVSLRNQCQSISTPPPEWLLLLSPCEMVFGEVELAFLDSPPEGDGDYELNLRLDAGQDVFLSPGNEALGGSLHAEIPLEDQRRLASLPQTGMHIFMIGAWVQNTGRNNWNEFHPVWYWAELP